MTNWFDSIDVDKYVTGLIDKEKLQIDKKTAVSLAFLGDSKDAYNVQVSAYGSLKSQLTSPTTDKSLQQVTQALLSAFNHSYQATSSDGSALTVSATTNPAPGTHTVVTTKLAQANTVGSTISTTSSSSGLGISEQLNFTAGSTAFKVTVNTGDSLQAICNNINTIAGNVSANVVASVITNASGQCQLLVSATKSGADNAVTITESGAHPLGLDTTVDQASGGAQVIKTAQDAEFTYDGISFKKPTNTNEIQGLSITLLSGTPSTPSTTTISVSASNPVGDVAAAVSNFIDSYNSAMNFIAKTQATGKGYDAKLAMLSASLSSTINAALGGDGTYNTLADLGIVAMHPVAPQTATVTTRESDGSITTKEVTYYPTGLLQLNTDPNKGAVLTTELANNFSKVQAALTGTVAVTETPALLSKLSTQLSLVPVRDTDIGSLTFILDNAEETAQSSLDDITQKITDQKTKIDKQKKDLPAKYAYLDVTLLRLQFTSRYLSQQMDAFKG